LMAAIDQPFGQPSGYGGIVDNAGIGYVECLDARGMRFDFPKSIGSDERTFDAVDLSTPVDLVQPGSFVFVDGHDDLPAHPVGDPLLTTKVDECALSLAAVSCLKRSRPLVHPRGDDTCMSAGLMPRHGILLFEDDDRVTRNSVGQMEGRGEPNDAAADHGEVVPIVHRFYSFLGNPDLTSHLT